MPSRHFKKLLFAVLASTAISAFANDLDDFIIAVKNDNVGKVGDFLDHGVDPNARNSKGQTGLTTAMMEHSPKAAKLLLDRPATDVNVLNGAGESPLMMAAIKGDLPGVRLLLERGAQVNLPGWSPLHYAACGPDPKIVQLLLDRGAEIDALSPNGTTPLMLAAQYGPEDNVRVLLAKGADLKRRNQRDLGALDFAKLSGRDPLVKELERLQR